MERTIESLGATRVGIGPQKKLKVNFPPNTVIPIPFAEQGQHGACSFCEVAAPIVKWLHRADPKDRDKWQEFVVCARCLLYESPWGKNRREGLDEVIAGLEEQFHTKYMRTPTGELMSVADLNRVVFSVGISSDALEAIAAHEISPLQLEAMLGVQGRGAGQKPEDLVNAAFGVEAVKPKPPLFVLVTPHGNYRLTEEQVLEIEDNPVDHSQVCPVPDEVRAACEAYPLYDAAQYALGNYNQVAPEIAPEVTTLSPETPRAPYSFADISFDDLMATSTAPSENSPHRIKQVMNSTPPPLPNWMRSKGLQAVLSAQRKATAHPDITATATPNVEPLPGKKSDSKK